MKKTMKKLRIKIKKMQTKIIKMTNLKMIIKMNQKKKIKTNRKIRKIITIKPT